MTEIDKVFCLILVIASFVTGMSTGVFLCCVYRKLRTEIRKMDEELEKL